jgi:hypothetical protein
MRLFLAFLISSGPIHAKMGMPAPVPSGGMPAPGEAAAGTKTDNMENSSSADIKWVSEVQSSLTQIKDDLVARLDELAARHTDKSGVIRKLDSLDEVNQ